MTLRLPSPPSTYQFSSSFTVLSGFTGATQVGNTLMLPGTDFADGVLEFNGSISSLTVGTLNSDVTGGQGLTFAASLGTTDPLPVPEPASVTLLLIAAAIAMIAVRRHRSLPRTQGAVAR